MVDLIDDFVVSGWRILLIGHIDRMSQDKIGKYWLKRGCKLMGSRVN